jgi:hypothetical protein
MARRKKAQHAAPAHFESYAEYNRILRSWFVAFGIGGPALFLAEDTLRSTLVASGETRQVVGLFLAGAAAQVLVAFLNKYANWYCYAGEDDAAFRQSRLYGFWQQIASQFWIDIILDLTTAACFLSAVWMVFGIFDR